MRTSLRTELLDRGYQPADKRALLRLGEGADEASWNARQLALFLRQERAAFRVIARRTLPAVPLAYFAIQHHEDALYIANLIVAPEWRRHGIGRFAVERILRIAGKLECERVLLDVQERNLGAQILYREHGFRATRIRPLHYADQDGYRMELRLDGAEDVDTRKAHPDK